MQVNSGQIFNLWDTNGRRSDVLNALRIYLEILREIKAEYPDERWAAYPASIAQFIFYQRAIERSPEVFQRHDKYDALMEHLGDDLPAFLSRDAAFSLSTHDRNVLDEAVEQRARHYTSNLVKIGLADSKRNESAVGTAFLRERIVRDPLEETLPINDTNLLLLRQLLKLRIFSKPIDGRMSFYSPCIMALLLLLANDTVDHSALMAVVQGLDPYLDEAGKAFVFANIGTVSAIEERLYQVQVDIPAEFQKAELLQEGEFSRYIRNRKSGHQVAVYYAFYKALYRFWQEKNEDTYGALMDVLSGRGKIALQKAFGCGKTIFDVGRGHELTLDEFWEKNHDHMLLASETFNRDFYLAYSKSNRADDIREYEDTTERLLSATGLLKFDPLPELAFKELLSQIFDEDVLAAHVFGTMTEAEYQTYEEDIDGEFMSNRSLAEILGYDAGQIAGKIAEIEKRLGVTGRENIRGIMRSKARDDFIRHIESKYTKERILELLPLFSDRKNDKKIQDAVNKAASVPTIYEYIVGIAWYYISGKNFDLYASFNLTLDADFEPVFHAGGGDGDIVVRYDDLAVMLEVTLMNKQAQKRGEWEPVLRHSLNLKASEAPKAVITFFVANELDHNTTNIWRAVAAATLESTNTHEQVDGVVIMPFTTKEITGILDAGVPSEKIIAQVFRSFAQVSQITDAAWKTEIMAQLLPS